jgi:hypothetical protein
VLLLALGKLSVQSGRPLTHEAQALLTATTASGSVELQQRALEVQALLRWAKKIGLRRDYVSLYDWTGLLDCVRRDYVSLHDCPGRLRARAEWACGQRASPTAATTPDCTGVDC